MIEPDELLDLLDESRQIILFPNEWTEESKQATVKNIEYYMENYFTVGDSGHVEWAEEK